MIRFSSWAVSIHACTIYDMSSQQSPPVGIVTKDKRLVTSCDSKTIELPTISQGITHSRQSGLHLPETTDCVSLVSVTDFKRQRCPPVEFLVYMYSTWLYCFLTSPFFQSMFCCENLWWSPIQVLIKSDPAEFQVQMWSAPCCPMFRHWLGLCRDPYQRQNIPGTS